MTDYTPSPIDTHQQQRDAAVPDLISVPEAERHVGLHADTLYRLCRSGKFPPALQIGARWRVSVLRLERYLHGDVETPWGALEHRRKEPFGTSPSRSGPLVVACRLRDRDLQRHVVASVRACVRASCRVDSHG